MRWRKVKDGVEGVEGNSDVPSTPKWRSDCGTFSIKKRQTHDERGNIMERYPWELWKGEKLLCCYGLLSDAKAYVKDYA